MEDTEYLIDGLLDGVMDPMAMICMEGLALIEDDSNKKTMAIGPTYQKPTTTVTLNFTT